MIQDNYSQLADRLYAGDADMLRTEGGIDILKRVGVELIVSAVWVPPQDTWCHHTICEFGDHQRLGPRKIESLLTLPIHLTAPRTFVHCAAGQNRSSMLACCWLLYYAGWQEQDAVDHVLSYRTLDLAKIGRGAAEMSREMQDNVHRFAGWLMGVRR